MDVEQKFADSFVSIEKCISCSRKGKKDEKKSARNEKHLLLSYVGENTNTKTLAAR